MKRSVSLYLDLLRIFAAVGVFLGHASFAWFSGRQHLFPALGHELVIGFFFLSGYVVAYATLEKKRGPTEYAVARLSRLYSVVLPAVVLTAVLREAGRWANPGFYESFERGHEWVRWILSVCFAQELWFASSSPPTNGPLWSLGYEFWFYALFGCWVFARGWWWRIVLATLVGAVAGPKLLFLLPVWLLGVAGWWLCKHVDLNRWTAWAGFVAGGGAAWWLAASGWCFPIGETATAPWFYSGRFLSDWALGFAILVHVVCFSQAFSQQDIPPGLEQAVRWGASKTFSLYVYHYPLLVFAAAVVPYDKESPVQVCAVLVLVLAGILGLHRITEQRRAWWQTRFSRMITCFLTVGCKRPKPAGAVV